MSTTTPIIMMKCTQVNMVVLGNLVEDMVVAIDIDLWEAVGGCQALQGGQDIEMAEEEMVEIVEIVEAEDIVVVVSSLISKKGKFLSVFGNTGSNGLGRHDGYDDFSDSERTTNQVTIPKEVINFNTEWNPNPSVVQYNYCNTTFSMLERLSGKEDLVFAALGQILGPPLP